MKTHIKHLVLFFLLLKLLVSCDYGPKATLNNNFEPLKHNQSIDFDKMIGIYELDSISKKKYQLDMNLKFTLEIKNDSTFITNSYIDNKTGKLILKPKTGYIYIYNPKNNLENYFVELKDLNSKTTELYYRKNDKTLALYVLTRGFSYLRGEADYLRYIKIKTDSL